MINLKTTFEKNKLSNSKKEELFLIELEGTVTKKNNESRKRLNISLCIDISFSMNEYIERACYNKNHFDFEKSIVNNILRSNEEKSQLRKKISLVKEAAINALSTMQDGDIISIVAFDNCQYLIQEATVLTKENRVNIIASINSLVPKGSTNIHSGWLRSVEEVAKNVSKDKLNRVVLLTDGQINSGKDGVDEICSDVRSVAGKNVSTSTFGVGEGFNEVLLSSMSDSGAGNFYFINDDKNFSILFNEEFTGMSNVCATNIELELNLKDGLLKEVLSDFKRTEERYLIQDLTSTNKTPLLFNFNTELLTLGLNDLGSVKVYFKDVDGNNQTIEKEIVIEVVSDEEYEKLEINNEIKVQEILVLVAKNKQKAKSFFDSGQINEARGLLRSSSNILMGANINDERLSSQTDTLGKTLLDSETKSASSMSKAMHYQAYRTFKGKD